MTPEERDVLRAEVVGGVLERALEDNARMRAALEEIAKRTIQRDLNRLAHAALGHRPNPLTAQLLAEIEAEKTWWAW